MMTREQASLDPERQASVDPRSIVSHSARIERLFRDHNESLLRFLAARLNSQQDAKEVAQEAYVRLLSLDAPGAVSHLRAFLFKTAANLAVDRLRKRNQHDRTSEQGLFAEFRETPTPDRELAGVQHVEVIEKLIGDLPPKCRRAFLLHRIQGFDFAETARQMGLSERMVRMYVIRALEYCRDGLAAADGKREASND